MSLVEFSFPLVVFSLCLGLLRLDTGLLSRSLSGTRYPPSAYDKQHQTSGGLLPGLSQCDCIIASRQECPHRDSKKGKGFQRNTGGAQWPEHRERSLCGPESRPGRFANLIERVRSSPAPDRGPGGWGVWLRISGGACCGKPVCSICRKLGGPNCGMIGPALHGQVIRTAWPFCSVGIVFAKKVVQSTVDCQSRIESCAWRTRLL